MKEVRWLLAVPAAMAAALLCSWMVALLFNWIDSAHESRPAGNGYWDLAAFVSLGLGTVCYVLVGVMVCPCKERWVCLAGFALSQFFSPGFLLMMGFGVGHQQAEAMGLAAGGLLGLVLGWHFQRGRRMRRGEAVVAGGGFDLERSIR